ncbi:MAG: hypothetical protein LAO55_17100 [Acidobacteriia bacterium]|nr:hypothetical protein [Terriglobia bacterium]
MRSILWLCIAIVAIPIADFAQQSEPLDSRVTAVLARMASSDRGTRNSAFDDLVGVITEGQQLGFDPEYSSLLAAFLARNPEQADRVKLGLINLLKADNVDTTLPAGYTAEDNSEHYAAAIDLVSSLNDDRAIPALVGALGTGGMATGGVIKYGEKALGPVLSALNNPNLLVRSAAVGTAVTILRIKNDVASQDQILGLIRTAIHDREFLIRSAALYQIDNLTDQKEFAPALQEFVPALEEMAQRDPFVLQRETRYPLRDRAKKLLDKITNH